MLQMPDSRIVYAFRSLTMRTTLAGLALLVCGLLILSHTSAPAVVRATQDPVRYEWQLEVQESGVTDDLYGVAFVSDQVGLAVGNANTILRTTDGGQSWQRLMERRERGSRFVELLFASPTEAWVRDSTGALLHTTNAGDTWRRVGLPSRCNDRGNAFAVAGSTVFFNCLVWVFKSEDAGRTWTELPGRLPHNDYQSMAFADPTHGWLVRGQGEGARYGGLTMTTDGGRSWQQASLLGGGQIGFHKVQFVTPATGWIMPGRQDVLLGTTDGGQTWDGFYTGIEPQVDFHFLDERSGFLLAYGNNTVGELLQSIDGGQSWQVIGQLTNPSYLAALHAPNAERVWVVGHKGYIALLRLVAVPVEP